MQPHSELQDMIRNTRTLFLPTVTIILLMVASDPYPSLLTTESTGKVTLEGAGHLPSNHLFGFGENLNFGPSNFGPLPTRLASTQHPGASSAGQYCQDSPTPSLHLLMRPVLNNITLIPPQPSSPTRLALGVAGPSHFGSSSGHLLSSTITQLLRSSAASCLLSSTVAGYKLRHK